MRGVNKIILLGNLGREPETRYTQDGRPITNFSVATTETWKDKQTGERREATEWHNVVCFARLAEIAGEFLRKGSKIYIEGQLKTSSWEQDGVKKYKTEVHAKNLQLLDAKEERPQYSPTLQEQSKPARIEKQPTVENYVDPFDEPPF